jgi:protein-S-isoprenylcysteine O-methyltransferase Ste14
MALTAFIAACALLLGFFVWERGSRQSAEAKSFARGSFDRGSTVLLASVFSLGFLLLPLGLLLNAVGIAHMTFPPAVAWVGIVVMTLGISLRIWASRVLGRYFTRTLRVAPEQAVVSDGPYRVVRHPGYLGDIVLWCGAAFATLNWITFVGLTLVALLSYSYRIQVEETMLQETLGAAYRAYMARTWRLLPLLY